MVAKSIKDMHNNVPINDETVTVVIPTFGRSMGLLEQSYFSVYCNDFKYKRVVLVCQGCPPGFVGELSRLAGQYRELDSKIVEDVTGEVDIIRCLNLGIGEAATRYICFMDERAVFYPSHLSSLVRILQGSDKAWAYSHYCTDFERDGYVVRKECNTGVDLLNENRVALHSIMIDVARVADVSLLCFKKKGPAEDNTYLLPEAAFHLEPAEYGGITSILKEKAAYGDMPGKSNHLSGKDKTEQIIKLLKRGHVRKVTRLLFQYFAETHHC